MHELRELFLTIFGIVIFVACVRAIAHVFSEWRAKRRAAAIRATDIEADQLCREISRLSPVKLTTEYVPQRFSSKTTAQAFGEKWSLGASDSFKAKAIDSEGRDEDHPRFDKTSISGGILYTYPALFFSMKDAHRDGDEWFLSFARARNQWLKNYLVYLERDVASRATVASNSPQ